jgi:murein DD-endopeptidase MepM/ murein hydrolase activator NlpD
MQRVGDRRFKAVRFKRNKSEKPSARQFWQLLFSLGILGLLLLCKTFWPQGTAGVQAFVVQHVASGVDLGKTVEDIGAAFSGRISEVFRAGTPHDDEAAAEDLPGTDITEPVPEEQEIPEEQNATEGRAELFGFGTGINIFELLSVTHSIPLIIEEEHYQTRTELEDDTWPLPFGMEKPDIVDFSAHEIPFQFTNPIHAPLTSPFGYRIHPIDNVPGFHLGVDLGASEGTHIHAFAAGTVEKVGYNSIYGNFVLVSHDDGFSTFYGHCQKVAVKERQKVNLGQKIAYVGNTGKSTGPHLHFEIRRNGYHLDPLQAVTPLALKQT